MLTGLWNIDEQASAIIMESFYKNLLRGMDKDDALRTAKLTYINTSDIPMQAPQYWAGLVLMGDTSAIILSPERASNWWLILGGLLVLVVGCSYAFYQIRVKKIAAKV